MRRFTKKCVFVYIGITILEKVYRKRFIFVILKMEFLKILLSLLEIRYENNNFISCNDIEFKFPMD